MANNSNQVQKTLGEQMADLLRRKPKNFDVTFSVGSEKMKVEAVKFILIATSPVFEREFEENWENGVVTGDDNGIPLPDIDPTSFQLFIDLLILDTWSLDSLKTLNLSQQNILNLLGLCRRYEIKKAIQNLEEIVDAFIQSFDKYKETEEFLEISRENLETIFSFENIPLDETEIFECASRWASNQCTVKRLEPTGENYRKVLGATLFQIRFPTMSTQEFTKIVLFKKNVLKVDEQLAVYVFIGLDIDDKKNWDESQLVFKTNRRVPGKLCRTKSEKTQSQNTNNPTEVYTSSSSGCSVLSLPQQCKLTTIPSFVCDGSQRIKHFQVNQKISLLGFGFLGPIDGDTHFDVTVQIKGVVNCSPQFDSGTFTKNILAQKGKIFHFLLDEPITVESNTYGASWGNRYDIVLSLKGPSNTSQYIENNPKIESLEASGVQFKLFTRFHIGNPLAELLFKKI